MEDRLEALFLARARRCILLQKPVVGIQLDIQQIGHFDCRRECSVRFPVDKSSICQVITLLCWKAKGQLRICVAKHPT